MIRSGGIACCTIKQTLVLLGQQQSKTWHEVYRYLGDGGKARTSRRLAVCISVIKFVFITATIERETTTVHDTSKAKDAIRLAKLTSCVYEKLFFSEQECIERPPIHIVMAGRGVISSYSHDSLTQDIEQ